MLSSVTAGQDCCNRLIPWSPKTKAKSTSPAKDNHLLFCRQRATPDNMYMHPQPDYLYAARLPVQESDWPKFYVRVERGLLGSVSKWRRHLKNRALKMDKEMWSSIERLRRTQVTADILYTTESIQLLGDYSKKAGAVLSKNLDHQGKRRRSVDDDALETEQQSSTSPTHSEHTSINDTIFGMGYKKLAGIQWKENELRLLEELDEGSPLLDIKSSLIPFVVKMLKSSLIPGDLPVLKLSLSGVVNTMNRNQFDKVKPYLSKNNYEIRLDELVRSFRCHGLNQDSLAVLDEVNAKLSNSNVEETLILVDELKRPYLERSGRSNQAYRMLKILEQLLESMGSHAADESEMTTTRRIAAIIEEIFRWTPVKLVDGEHTSDCTQSVRQYNDIVYGNNVPENLPGRKVDLLVKSGATNKHIELSSIEIKKPLTSPSLALEQQCKNLRTNGAILGHLQVLNSAKKFDHVVAMDWIGMVGYMYLLVDDQGIYFGKKIGILRLPKAPKDFIDFKKTLDLLFAYQHTILNTAIEAQSAMDARQDLDRLCEIIDTQDQVDTFPRHDILFTPSSHHTRK